MNNYFFKENIRYKTLHTIARKIQIGNVKKRNHIPIVSTYTISPPKHSQGPASLRSVHQKRNHKMIHSNNETTGRKAKTRENHIHLKHIFLAFILKKVYYLRAVTNKK